MIAIINYGLGNIKAFQNVYERLNVKSKVAQRPSDIESANKLILPEVGAFDYAMDQLNKSGLRDVIEEKVLGQKIPILGICVGMQIMAKSSDEGKLPGLGWFDAEVKLFDTGKIPYRTRLPHMGWNTISRLKENILLEKIDQDSRFYFLHSYYVSCVYHDNVIAETQYGLNYASAIKSGNIFGVQFHPEKSHQQGVQLLINFAKKV